VKTITLLNMKPPGHAAWGGFCIFLPNIRTTGSEKKIAYTSTRQVLLFKLWLRWLRWVETQPSQPFSTISTFYWTKKTSVFLSNFVEFKTKKIHRMETWIALLRGINVGGNHNVPMKELVKLLEANGFEQVKTYIQSGNVIFQSAGKPADVIGHLIENKFGFKPAVFLLRLDDLKKAATNNPFRSDDGKAVHFFFLAGDPTSVDFELLDSVKTASEDYRLIEKVFYLYAPEGIGRSRLVDKLGKAIPGVSMTARNLNTINKLIEMTA
jgi:uncharacterized protein (DUF1697 family)